MNKNIRQNYFLQIKNILNKVDEAGDIANHFRAIVLIGDKSQDEAYSWLHAPIQDMEKLLLHAIRNSDTFAYCVAKALEARYKELKKEKI